MIEGQGWGVMASYTKASLTAIALVVGAIISVSVLGSSKQPKLDKTSGGWWKVLGGVIVGISAKVLNKVVDRGLEPLLGGKKKSVAKYSDNKSDDKKSDSQKYEELLMLLKEAEEKRRERKEKKDQKKKEKKKKKKKKKEEKKKKKEEKKKRKEEEMRKWSRVVGDSVEEEAQGWLAQGYVLCLFAPAYVLCWLATGYSFWALLSGTKQLTSEDGSDKL